MRLSIKIDPGYIRSDGRNLSADGNQIENEQPEAA